METTNVTAIAIGGMSARVALANGWRMNTTAPSNGRKVDALVDATGETRVHNAEPAHNTCFREAPR